MLRTKQAAINAAPIIRARIEKRTKRSSPKPGLRKRGMKWSSVVTTVRMARPMIARRQAGVVMAVAATVVAVTTGVGVAAAVAAVSAAATAAAAAWGSI